MSDSKVQPETSAECSLRAFLDRALSNPETKAAYEAALERDGEQGGER